MFRSRVYRENEIVDSAIAPLITTNKILSDIKQVKNKKALGEDNILAEII